MLIRRTDIPELRIDIQIRFDRGCFLIPSSEFIIRRIRFCCIRGCCTGIFCRRPIWNIALCLDTPCTHIESNGKGSNACSKRRVYISVFDDVQKRRRITRPANFQRPSNKGIGFRCRRRLRRCTSTIGDRSAVNRRRCTENGGPIIVVEITHAADILITDVDVRVFLSECLHSRTGYRVNLDCSQELCQIFISTAFIYPSHGIQLSFEGGQF